MPKPEVDRRRMLEQEDFRAWWRRWRLSEASHQWWTGEALLGLGFAVIGIIGGSAMFVVFGFAMFAVSICVIRSRWGLRRITGSSSSTEEQVVEDAADENDISSSQHAPAVPARIDDRDG